MINKNDTFKNSFQENLSGKFQEIPDISIEKLSKLFNESLKSQLMFANYFTKQFYNSS